MSDAPYALARNLARKPASGSPSATRPDAGYAPGADMTPRANTGLGILVGYDGSPDSERALIWAAREARARKTALTVCQAWGSGFPVLPDEEAVRKFARRSGERVISEGLRFARSLMGPTDVRPMLVPGSATAALCEHSREADIVVTGAKGQGGMAGTLLGSVSEHVAAYAHGSIVVVRGHWRPAAGLGRGAVVVGADGSRGCRAAVDFAFAQAALWEVPLVAVCALADAPASLGNARVCQDDFEATIGAAETERPQVAAKRSITPGGPRSALLTASRDAQIVVVGSRGRGGFKGMTLGTVSQAVLQYAPCPVAVIHPA
jgi:nucleotide-binding universal stress UspA family protein